MSAPQDIKVGNFRGKCSALEGRIQQLHEQVKELEADNAKLHYRQEVLTQLCFSTQWLSSILAVNGPRLEGPLHAGMCSTTKSVVDQVGRDLEQLLGWSSSPPSLLPPPFHSTIALDDVVNSCVMSGSCMGVLEYALASIHAAPEQFACWVSATVQQAGAREALLRGGWCLVHSCLLDCDCRWAGIVCCSWQLLVLKLTTARQGMLLQRVIDHMLQWQVKCTGKLADPYISSVAAAHASD
jgi:hypothetical protein